MIPANMPTTAMVLAAGYGTRMRPLTLTTPKPLLEVGGRTMLDQVLDRLAEAGVRRVIVNAAYLGDQIARHVTKRTDLDIVVSREDEPLETGGGIKNALPLLGDAPVFVINADLPWQDGAEPALFRLAKAWDPEKMDVLLLAMPREKVQGFSQSQGDYKLAPDGRLRRLGLSKPLPHVFISARITKPELYKTVEERVFSDLRIFDHVEARDRLFGLVHTGTCFHVGTPEDLAEANRLLQNGKGWAVLP